MSDGSNSSNSTVEDANMESPRPSQPSGTSTPAQAHIDSDSNMTPAPSIGQDTPSNQTPAHAIASTVASPAGTQPTEQQQQHQGSPMSSAPSTPSNNAGLGAASPLAKTVESSASAPISVSTGQSALQTTQREGNFQQQNQEQQLLLLQKQAQADAHLAQLQQAHAASLGSANTAVASVAQHSLAVGAALQSRKEEELNRKDRTLAEFLPMMENYNPIIPDAVTDYYLSRTGFDCDDVRIKRLLALAAQKFVSDIATDAFQYCKVRQQSQKRAPPGKEKKTVLTMEDLSDALGEYGINVKKPDYFM